ncbi:uncharacterized protein LOC143560893 [Bidens hawaiensis]|uniref:uncharacterized protein LOC143560893 n=1 Tax=Bidens hawaiensis TaxID=980011 RepID=UPI00404AD4DB
MILLFTEADPGPNYAKIMGEYKFMEEAKLPISVHMIQKPKPDEAMKSVNKLDKKGNLSELEVVQYGYLFYEKFRGLFVDTLISQKERNRSRDFFLNRISKDAFKVVEVELNFIYEVLFTKFPVVYVRIGAISLVFSLATVCLAIVLFIIKSKTNYSKVDVPITYGLLFGALILDLGALFMHLLSDRTIIALWKSPYVERDKSLKARIATLLLTPQTKSTIRVISKSHPTLKRIDQPQCYKLKVQRRWSETISTFNLIYYSSHPNWKPWQNIFDKLGLSEFLDGIFYVKSVRISPDLKDFIFHELKLLSELVNDMDTARDVISARGDRVLRIEEGWSRLLKYVIRVDYDESLILWHISTEICYNVELHNKRHVQV